MPTDPEHIPLSLTREPNWLTRVNAQFGEPKIHVPELAIRDEDYGRITRWLWVWFPVVAGKAYNHSVKLDLAVFADKPLWRVQIRSHDLTRPNMEWDCRREPSNDDIELLLTVARFLEVDNDGADH